MTPDTQARAGYRRPQVRPAASGQAASGQAAAPLPPPGPAPREDHRPLPPRSSERAARRAREDASIVKIIPLLAVMVVTAAGVYIAWLKGSAGGGEGGVVAGAGLLLAAAARLLLPTRLVGLLANRKRALDVITLGAFGVCLVVAGLVLPR